MSRAYRITWVTVGQTVTASDRMKVPVALLGILDAGEMAALLERELEKDGWKKNADGSLSTLIEGADVTLDGNAEELTIAATSARTVETRATRRDEAEAKLARKADEARRAIEASPARTIARAEPEVRARVGEAVQRVYKEALARKAASLGEVESVVESQTADGEREIVIKVRT